ncbi:MAG: type II toxin-antitoxin system YafQ family toxin [Sutterellaceae bacterium]|nr:type II toxin-antitoxin system YafQ family toxin [Sutterellaceae bacterium]MDD7441241.1 type II toxin-antitoxin system YafQ family toxin [Sutterellaceae bacterium]MDY2869241.1 type II toxin-antitoxin system YafQ family toxin [Mesosutterella sp.]
MTLRIIATSAYKKDYKKALKANRKMDLLDSVVWQLSEGKKLSESFRDHSLTGNWSGYRECHIKPDWLLIYRVIENKLVLVLARTGTHSELF